MAHVGLCDGGGGRAIRDCDRSSVIFNIVRDSCNLPRYPCNLTGVTSSGRGYSLL